MLEDEDTQFHSDLSPKKREKNEKITKKDQNLCIICQMKGSFFFPKMGHFRKYHGKEADNLQGLWEEMCNFSTRTIA